MDLTKAQELIEKYRRGTLTHQEKAWLESWYLDIGKTQPSRPMAADDLQRHLDSVWDSLPVNQPAERSGRPLFLRIAVAASVLIFCMVGAYFIYSKNNVVGRENVAYIDDAVPGGNRAILTLADGAKIALDAMKNGELAREGNTAIIKTKAGEIVYKSGGAGHLKAGSVAFNTVVTPVAGQYQVTLPDGTKVWMNAASSIRFPTKFPEHERVVEMMGEVYFEVAKVTDGGKRIPFKVMAGDQLVEVLGTRFNINSYKDEGQIKTTLVEGSISVNVDGNKKKEVLLRPGQQSRLVTGGPAASVSSQFDVQEVNAGSVIAWKDGYFQFDHVGLPELMRQLSRWYGMQVVYNVPVKEYEFVGQIERSSRLSKVLRILEMGDVHFRIEGKKIIVTE